MIQARTSKGSPAGRCAIFELSGDQMSFVNNPERAMKMIHHLLLAVYTLALAGVSVWAFSHGVEPRPIAGGDHPALVSAVAAVSIAAWGHLLFYLFRGMLRLRLSNGWCPVLLAGAFAILFLILGCFGPMTGV